MVGQLSRSAGAVQTPSSSPLLTYSPAPTTLLPQPPASFAPALACPAQQQHTALVAHVPGLDHPGLIDAERHSLSLLCLIISHSSPFPESPVWLLTSAQGCLNAVLKRRALPFPVPFLQRPGKSFAFIPLPASSVRSNFCTFLLSPFLSHTSHSGFMGQQGGLCPSQGSLELNCPGNR